MRRNLILCSPRRSYPFKIPDLLRETMNLVGLSDVAIRLTSAPRDENPWARSSSDAAPPFSRLIIGVSIATRVDAWLPR